MRKTHIVYLLALFGIFLAFYSVVNRSLALFLLAMTVHLIMGVIGLCTPRVGVIARVFSLIILVLWVALLLPSPNPVEEERSEEYLPAQKNSPQTI